MTIKKMIYSTAVVLIAFTSCSKDELKNETLQQDDSFNKNMTLIDFIQSRETKEEIDHLLNIQPVDNRELAERNMLSPLSQDRMLVPINSQFKYGGDNMCVTCEGLCENIVPSNGYYTALFEMVGVGSLNIIPIESELENAFTADGFFIVYYDVAIGEEASASLGIPTSSYIQSGIYSAYYDEALEQYTSVVVNLGM